MYQCKMKVFGYINGFFIIYNRFGDIWITPYIGNGFIQGYIGIIYYVKIIKNLWRALARVILFPALSRNLPYLPNGLGSPSRQCK